MGNKSHIRSGIHAFTALLLAAWYLVTVGGFDIHSDREHGRSYLVSGSLAHDCEAIHPLSHCHEEDAGGECLSGEDCCFDALFFIMTLGEDTDSSPAVPAVASGSAFLSPDIHLSCRFGAAPSRPHAPPLLRDALQVRYCVLRS